MGDQPNCVLECVRHQLRAGLVYLRFGCDVRTGQALAVYLVHA